VDQQGSQLQDQKFSHPKVTATGEPRAYVELEKLETLWINSGTLCNLHCDNCYIESSPKNDRLSFFRVSDLKPFLRELDERKEPVEMIGITGGEPFLNPNITDLLDEVLKAGFEALVLTNAFRVWKKHKDNLLTLQQTYGDKLHIRVSLDHYSKKIHETERGPGTFEKTMEAMKWFYDHNFDLSLAGRSLVDEDLGQARVEFQKLLEDYGINLSLEDKLVIFPEMDLNRDVPEITTACWGILNKKPQDQMCATERMLVLRKGEDQAKVLPCTLLAYDPQFEMGTSLSNAEKKVYLNHKFCAQFCVLGGASCSSTK
jgi:MoaA/NifB/PqqE/SkfB family radical SAM enzyme